MLEFDIKASGDKEQLAALEALRDIISPSVQIDVPGSHRSVMAAQALKEAQRNFFQGTSSENNACINKYKEIVEAAIAKVQSGNTIDVEQVRLEALKAVKAAYVTVIINNIKNQTAPSGVAPLKPETVKRKGHSQVGINTGALLEELRSALLK
jgi:hypothetical protein